MRIAQVSPLIESVPPRLYGGTERVVSWLTEELVAQGHDVTLFASGDSRTSARLVSGCSEALRLSGKCGDTAACHMALAEQVLSRARDFDVIHWHIDYLHFPASQRESACNLTTLHGRLDLPELVPLYQHFDRLPLVSISDSQRRPLDFAAWAGTVYHGMPVNSYRMYPGPGRYLAFLGRFSPEKGPDRAIRIARQAGMPLKLAAKIDPKDSEYFETVIKPMLNEPGIEYVGEIHEDGKNEFLGNAAALLFPIDWPEPFGLVMIEALACGTPVIAWPQGSVPEVLTDGVSGRLVTSVDQAVAAVQSLGDLSRQACRREFEKRFSVGRMASDYLRLYHHLTAGSQPLSANGAAVAA